MNWKAREVDKAMNDHLYLCLLVMQVLIRSFGQRFEPSQVLSAGNYVTVVPPKLEITCGAGG